MGKYEYGVETSLFRRFHFFLDKVEELAHGQREYVFGLDEELLKWAGERRKDLDDRMFEDFIRRMKDA